MTLLPNAWYGKQRTVHTRHGNVDEEGEVAVDIEWALKANQQRRHPHVCVCVRALLTNIRTQIFTMPEMLFCLPCDTLLHIHLLWFRKFNCFKRFSFISFIEHMYIGTGTVSTDISSGKEQDGPKNPFRLLCPKKLHIQRKIPTHTHKPV